MAFDHDELRIIALSGDLWLKMVREKEKKVLDKLYGQFRNGETEKCLLTVAEFCVIRDQFSDINSALRKAQEPEKEK
jgi:hypothetical protein